MPSLLVVARMELEDGVGQSRVGMGVWREEAGTLKEELVVVEDVEVQSTVLPSISRQKYRQFKQASSSVKLMVKQG